MFIRSIKFRRHLACVACFAVLFVFCLAGSVYALEDESALPHVAKWVNGLGVSDEGVYLSDTWAIDDTGVSPKKYVLLGQKSTEVMRVEKYPEDITDGDTTPCEKFTATIALDLPDGASGDVFITLENEVAEYFVTFSEENNYKKTVELYPGVYETAHVEVAGDIGSAYRVGNYYQIDASSDMDVSFEIVKADGEDVGSGGADPSGSADDGESGKNNSPVSAEENNELFWDTVKLFVVVVILFAIYAVIKYRRQKSEEMKQ